MDNTRINKKLKEVSDYFKQKIIAGDFEFKSCCGRTATIIIDGKHEFTLWIANDQKNNFDYYSIEGFPAFMRFRTQKERLSAWKQIKPYVRDYERQVIKREKQKQLNKLKKELESM